MNCNSGNEVWKETELIHEGSNDVKLNKINLVTQQYELFILKQGEMLKNTYERFLTLINEMRSYEKEYLMKEVYDKVTRVVLVSWKMYTLIVKGELNNEITLSKLYGRLQNDELEVEQQTAIQLGSNPSSILESSLLSSFSMMNAFTAQSITNPIPQMSWLSCVNQIIPSSSSPTYSSAEHSFFADAQHALIVDDDTVLEQIESMSTVDLKKLI